MTVKQRKFVKRYLENGGNGTQAALDAYNTDDPKVAKVIASKNLTLDNIKMEIELALERAGLSDEYISELLRDATTAGMGVKATNADSLRGIDMMLKLKGAYPTAIQKSAHIRIDYRQQLMHKSTEELEEELRNMQAYTNEFLDDINS